MHAECVNMDIARVLWYGSDLIFEILDLHTIMNYEWEVMSLVLRVMSFKFLVTIYVGKTNHKKIRNIQLIFAP